MSKYERCREDVIVHTEQARMPWEDRRCPVCNGTGEGKEVLLGLGRSVKEDTCRGCRGTGYQKDAEDRRMATKEDIAARRGSIDRFKDE